MAKLGQAVAAAKVEYDSAAARLEELRQRLKECDREISSLAADKATLAQQVTDLAVDKKKLQHKCVHWSSEIKSKGKNVGNELHWFSMAS